MPANTTKHGLPYPLGTDSVGSADATIKSIAEMVDTKIDLMDMQMNGGKRVSNLCLYSEPLFSGTGAILIQTNLPGNSMVMTTLRLTGYTYEPDNNIIDMDITFYPFSDFSIHNAEVTNRGSFSMAGIQILNRNSDGKVAIALNSGSLNSSYWYYPSMVVDGIFGHTDVADSTYLTGWTMHRVANITGYTVKSDPLTPRGMSEDSGWITPSLINGWIQYNSSQWPCEFRRIGGIVHIRGLLSPPADSTPTMWYMPLGFRPYKATLRGAIDSTSGPKHLYIYADGAVQMPAGASVWASLEGINYPAIR